MKWLAKFVMEDNGATAIEYSIIVAAISAIIIGIVFTLGTQVQQGFTNTSNALPAAGP